MTKKQYRFNPETLVYEEVKKPFRLSLYRLLRFSIIVFIIASILSLLLSSMFVTPKMRKIVEERDELLTKYAILDSKIEINARKLDELKYRDQRVYRNLFAVDTLSVPNVFYPYPPERYARLNEVPYGTMINHSWHTLDMVGRRTYLRSLSLDEIQELALTKEDMAHYIPAIWPIDKRYLKSISPFNPKRFHPIYKVIRPHNGLDLATDKIGRPVYATADGVVKRTDRGQAKRGYGKLIEINHGYGYQTKYAHLDEILVKRGQKVKRGELIGKVGNTGGSTSQHLHYEVIYLNKPVDPIMYFHQDMSEEDFLKIIESADNAPMETDE